MRSDPGVTWMFRCLGWAAALSALLTATAPAAPNLFFLQAPQGEVAPDSVVRIAVGRLPPGTKAPDSCKILRSGTPAGDSLGGHPDRIAASASLSSDSTARILAFTPSTPAAGGSPQLGLGFHYLIAACEEGKYVTSEIPLWVSSRQSVSILSPKSEEASASPSIAWTPVPGVPAYHLLLSDQALNIDADKGTVSGASVIWQAITTKTSIAYGTPDPSGNFSQVPAPPLSPNVPYNLVILNNYDGRSALATSAKAQGLKLFTLKAAAAALSKPKNIEPLPAKTLTVSKDSLVRFKWTAAKAGAASANTYKLYVYSLEATDAAQVLIPIWQTEVTDTTTVLDAKRTLLSKRYIWKVFALNEAGAGVVGDTTSFQYQNDVQTLNLTTRTLGPGGDTIPLGDVRIDVVPLDGSADALPLFSVNSGSAEKVLSVGGYALTFAKSGYVTQSRTVVLDLTAPAHVDQFLPPASCRITGHAVDGDGRDLDNVGVTASGGGRTVTSLSDANGYFLLGVAPGTQAISFAKSDYQAPRDTVVSLAAGKSLDLGRILLARPQGSLSGTVVNDKGAPLPACQILVKKASGTLLRTLLSDDKGAFSAFLAPGDYVIAASRTGFTGDERAVRLTDAANLRFQLASGASVVKGRISILAWTTASAPQTSPLPGAAVELAPKALNGVTPVIQKTEADLRGEYSFSADTGTYTLRVSRPGRALPDSAAVHIAAARSTVIQDVPLQGLASIQGALTLSPDTAVNPASASISLLKATTLELLRTAVPQAAPVPGGAGNMAFTLDGIPDGTYRVTCGLPGYGLNLEPEVTIANAVWKTDLNLTLRKSLKAVTFVLSAGGKSASGTIRLLTPQALSLAGGQKLNPAPSGTYTLSAAPDSAALIPLSRFTFSLPAGGAADTTIALGFPFSHAPAALTFRNQEVEMSLSTSVRPDTVLLVYGYGAPQDTFRVPSSSLIGPAGAKTFRFKPPAQGGLLTYYFIIRSGALTYSNEDPARRFRAPVEPSHELAFLRIAAGDSLRLPSDARFDLLLHAYDAGGNRLDSAVDAHGTVAWAADSDLPLKLGKKTRRDVLVQTGSPSHPPAKASASLTAGRAAGTASWDTLRVTVTLDDITRTLAVPARVVSSVINKLALSTALGEVSELPAPATFGIFVAGFDTNTTPPTPMVPNPEISLVPAQAGTVKEMQVSLDPRFIGPLRILARQANADGSEAVTELGAYRDSLQRGLNVGQTLRPGDSARVLFHDPLFELRLGDSALSASSASTAGTQAILRMYKRSVSKTFASGVTDAVASDLYEISNPSGAVFSKSPRLILGIPAAARSRKNRLRRFDALKLAWKDMADSVASEPNSFSAPAFAADIPDLDGSYYGLLGESQALTVGEMEVVPNPFSPLVLAARDGNTQYGTRIRLHPESARSAEVTISIKIYNLGGELIRHLVENKTVPKAPVDFYWDGKADGGRWARNGRYLVKVSLTSTGTAETRQLIRPVVVFQ